MQGSINNKHAEKPIRIATRSSQLALWQANYVSKLISQSSPDRDVVLVEISTQGDRDQSGSLQEFGGLGVFTNEVQQAILDNRADMAVHSLKDLPTEQFVGLTLASVPERAPHADVVVLPDTTNSPECSVISDATKLLSILPEKSRIGTSSPRRQAQLLQAHQEYQLLDIRGNVDTRIRKLNEGAYDAIILAEAGLRRLGLEKHISAILKPTLMFSAVGQGALGLECREDDHALIKLLGQINDPDSYIAVSAERSLLRHLRAGCHAPVGVETQFNENRIHLEAVVLSPDGLECVSESVSGDIDQAEQLGVQLADQLYKNGASRLL